jgi:glutamine synthetase
MYRHPFHTNGDHFLVMCDTYDSEGKPIPTNTRAPAQKVFDQVTEKYRPMFAYEQEYSMFYNGTHLGWPVGGYPAPQGPYYCSVGIKNAFGRDVAESHYHASLYAGINVTGINAEVMAGQWEYQVGPVVGIEVPPSASTLHTYVRTLTVQLGVVRRLPTSCG